ncbi:hypothetical protein MPSEU_000041600 [Mayamaea pseudoterrestris]|nr:hypothetical protein MPSEU_000041600 [Mayamaea pseudoterrestris]
MGKKSKATAGNRRRVQQNGYLALDDDDDSVPRRKATTTTTNNTRYKGGKSTKRNGKSGSSPLSAEDVALRRSITEDGTKEIIEVSADGNCLFRALSDQLYYDHGAAHEDVRSDVCNYLQAHETDFCHFLVLDDEDAPPNEEDASDFTSYVEKMRRDGTWGGNVELVAAARLYRRNILVHSADLDTFMIDCDESNASHQRDSVPNMMVSYHDNDHYNSVRDTRMSKPPTFTKVYFEMPATADGEEEDYDLNADNGTDDTATTDNENESDETADTVATADDSGHGSGGDAVQQVDNSINDAATSSLTPSKSAPCPCGSGRRYRKCCMLKERQATRTRNESETKEDARTRLASEEELELGGPMRVMVI